MHATDKLKEARFFLGEMRQQPKGVEFRYRMSAFLSAARSVTFALQKDYRSHFGDMFDVWYETKRREIVAHPLGRVITSARNTFQKEGNKLYWRGTRRASSLTPEIVLEFNLEKIPITCDGIEHIAFNFPRDPSGDGYWQGINFEAGIPEGDAIRKWIDDHSPRLFEDLGRALEEGEWEWEVALGKTLARTSTSELFAEIESYLELLQKILDEARVRFEEA